jgi:ABC-type nitrate/sulfonate/bicarbonate transport system ATPase subunit
VADCDMAESTRTHSSDSSADLGVHDLFKWYQSSHQRRGPSETKRVPVLAGVTLHVEAGQIVGMVGPSGCGKSTLLRIIAGLEPADGGEVRRNGCLIRRPDRHTGLIFQQPTLFPWLTVRRNIEFALEISTTRNLTSPGESVADCASRLLADVGLRDSVNLYPRQLSGGMKQRAALARALATKPQILLLDEPFASLDGFSKLGLYDLLLKQQCERHITMVLVTHDIDEAILLSDRIVCLSDRPARVLAEIPVPIARPRLLNGRRIEGFDAVREQVAAVFSSTRMHPR